MKQTFFLDYCKAMHEGTKADNQLKGDCKRIFNEFMTARDNVFFALATDREEQINFLLFCAAENNEL